VFTISHEYKSPNVSSREGTAITTIVLHATVGSFESARSWLCSPSSGVSSHYLISKDCQILQLVSDDLRAHHAGVSAWQGVRDVNDFSIGIELENNNTGSDPYPATQLAALRWLVQQLLTEHHLTPDAIITHAQCALPNGRKSDPANFPLELFRASLTPPPASPSYTEASPILGVPPLTAGQVYAALAHRFPVRTTNPAMYTRADVADIVEGYWRVCEGVGVNPLLAVSQMLHETAYLKSWWCQRPRRNSAGIGVDGKTQVKEPADKQAWAYDSELRVWRHGLSFKSWQQQSIPAHVGRLLGYTVHPGSMTDTQRELYRFAIAFRPLPPIYLGCAPILQGLEGTWAVPGTHYADRISIIANSLLARPIAENGTL